MKLSIGIRYSLIAHLTDFVKISVKISTSAHLLCVFICNMKTENRNTRYIARGVKHTKYTGAANTMVRVTFSNTYTNPFWINKIIDFFCFYSSTQ